MIIIIDNNNVVRNGWQHKFAQKHTNTQIVTANFCLCLCVCVKLDLRKPKNYLSEYRFSFVYLCVSVFRRIYIATHLYNIILSSNLQKCNQMDRIIKRPIFLLRYMIVN